MTYITRDIAYSALRRMRVFYEEARQMHWRYGLELNEDLGRRNVLLSNAQEKFFSQALREWAGLKVQSDGRTGQSDIVVSLPDGTTRELECKLTTRNTSGAVVLQTDWVTLSRKGSLDYLYVVADERFECFAVLHFEGLTTDNFRTPSSGSRGKAAMLKHTCANRCHVPIGGYHRVNDRHISAIEQRLAGRTTPKQREKLEARLAHWQSDPGRFEVELSYIY